MCLLLKQLTYSRPRLPFSSVLLTQRFRASGREHRGHRVNGTAPYLGHFDLAAEELDICAPEEEFVAGEREARGKGKEAMAGVGQGRCSFLTTLGGTHAPGGTHTAPGG